MRKISANYVYPVSSEPVKNGIVVVDDDGTILDVLWPQEGIETANTEFYNGILIPGLVNCHCHLELSYLANKIPQGTGLPSFIVQIIQNRDMLPDDIADIICHADETMQKSGIVAVGDISNSEISFFCKQNSRLYYHTFIEISGTNAEKEKEKFHYALEMEKKCREHYRLPCSLSPHASYSLSPGLLAVIKKHHEEKPSIYSLHFLETESENNFFAGKPNSLDISLQRLAIPKTTLQAQTTLQAIIPFLPEESNILLVHNIYISQNDIQLLQSLHKKIFFVLNPLSNLYIEKRLPDVGMLYSSGIPVTLGTDSLASNRQISVLEEMKTLSQHFPSIAFHDLLQSATLNGAKALGIDHWAGSLTKGKKPGINLIEHFDFSNNRLIADSNIKVIL